MAETKLAVKKAGENWSKAKQKNAGLFSYAGSCQRKIFGPREILGHGRHLFLLVAGRMLLSALKLHNYTHVRMVTASE